MCPLYAGFGSYARHGDILVTILLSDNSTPELHGTKQHFVLLMDSGVRNLNIAESLVFCWDLIWEDWG